MREGYRQLEKRRRRSWGGQRRQVWREAEYARRREAGDCVFEFKCPNKAKEGSVLCLEHEWGNAKHLRADYKEHRRWEDRQADLKKV